jgi:hypothetical protein|tara:strand:- start:1413 stop:2210 length:798 start_codon:yes stop_codon:yes gene_type:complete
MSTNVVKKEEAGLPAELMDDIMLTAGEGVDYDTSELQIPFIRVIQALSPQIKKSDPAFIKDAGQGDAFNTVTGQFWSGEDGITVIPCFQETKYLEFIPLDQGGGFVGERKVTDPDLANTERNGAKEILPNGNELVKSDQHYCVIVGEDGMNQPAIVDMKSTQLKVSRRWKTQIAMQKVKDSKGQMRTPALYATMWKLSTTEESNQMGTWYNWQVEKVGFIQDKAMFDEAKSFRESIAKGEVKAAADPETSDSGATKDLKDDDIPF